MLRGGVFLVMSHGYRKDIDGLRAIAVASVVVFHAFPEWLSGGFIGVDIFFVISGYLITGILIEDAAANNLSIWRFYERRIRRIFPALILVLVASLVFGWVALFPLEYEQLGQHALAAVAFLSNIQLWSEAGYFDAAAHAKPLLHLWSLGIEEQFYLFWPLVVWAAIKARVSLIIVVVVLGALSFAVNVSILQADPISAFYLPHMRIWELLIGAGLAVLVRRMPPIRTRVISAAIANVLSFTGLALIVGAIASLTSETPFPGWSALPPTIGAALMIAAGEKAWVNRYFLSLRPLVWVGLISYPLYLWHWPLLSFASIVEGGAVAFDLRVLLVIVSVALAAATYLLVERPIRRYRIRSLFIVPGSLVAMALIAVFGHSIVLLAGIEERSAIQHLTQVAGQFVGPKWAYSTDDECMNRYPLEGVENFGWWFCVTNSDQPPQILLYGTSLANQMYPGIVSNPAFAGKSVLSIGTCEPIWIDPELPFGEEGFSPCSGDRAVRQQYLIDSILAGGSVEYVIIAGLWPDPPPSFVSALIKRISQIDQAGAKLILTSPYVAPAYDIRSCFARPFKTTENDCVVPLREAENLSATFLDVGQAVHELYPDVVLFDTNRLFCDDRECSMIHDGMPMLRDEHLHWSEFASHRAADLLAELAATTAPNLLSMEQR